MVGRNLATTFQQHSDQAIPQGLQDTMEDTLGEEEDEEFNTNELQGNNEYDSELNEDNVYEADKYIEEEDEFMTPPSSPAQNENPTTDDQLQTDENTSTAPLNPQYNENTGSAGATSI